MTATEFSNEFDILYNNITSNQAPGLDAYEKSVFLTKAQDEIVKAYFSPKGNKYQEGFDDSRKRQVDFSSLIGETTVNISSGGGPVDPRGVGVGSVSINANYWMILNETIKVQLTGSSPAVYKYIPVTPISYSEYSRLMMRPFARPLSNQAWRIEGANTTSGNTTYKSFAIVINPKYSLVESNSYTVKYIKKPSPIIVETITGGLTIDGSSTQATCALSEVLHREILQRAVELAKSAYQGDLNSSLTLGQVSGTNLGIIAQNN